MGLVFNIQKYALHDGPGIRTTVFLKGCPLSCQWCHNPESIRPDIEIIYNENKCIHCGMCHNFTKAEFCPTLALEYVGKEMTPQEVFDEIAKDIVFYDQSGGGVTFSGGEPLLQSDFLLELLKLCKKHQIHTAIDTSGMIDFSRIEPLLEYIDLFLYDLKHMDRQIHKKYTGSYNDLIKDNYLKIIQTHEVYLRIPLIKGVNDSLEHINAVLDFAMHDHLIQVNLLAYHAYAEHKYEKTDRAFKMFEPPSQDSLEALKDLCLSKGLECKIGG